MMHCTPRAPQVGRASVSVLLLAGEWKMVLGKKPSKPFFAETRLFLSFSFFFLSSNWITQNVHDLLRFACSLFCSHSKKNILIM
jgi:hypothetical protein